MKSIYILLTNADTYVSKLIQFATSDAYTHASISFDASLQPLYSFARRFSFVPLPAGLRRESFKKGFFKRHPEMPCALFELPVPDAVYDAAKGLVEGMMQESFKYRYNVIGLLLCKMNISFPRRRRFFCSQFIGEILDKSNALDLPKEPSLMRPVDYANHPDLMCTYEGDMSGLIQSVNIASVKI
ncbi:MAG: hypothetical protein IJN74_01945 [Clostridia bacterium]|nr:hypothetical protein [Clostridia bacterium]